MKKKTAEQKAIDLLALEASRATEKLKSAAELAMSVLATAKESTDRDFALAQQISELRGVTQQGFKNIEEHFKLLNGQVGDHTKIINKLLAKEDVSLGKKQLLSTFWRNTITIVTIILSFLALFKWGRI